LGTCEIRRFVWRFGTFGYFWSILVFCSMKFPCINWNHIFQMKIWQKLPWWFFSLQQWDLVLACYQMDQNCIAFS
jgi:hypothetical protein